VYCKGWVEKQIWKEINDILRINGFAWLSSGKDSCWIKDDLTVILKIRLSV